MSRFAGKVVLITGGGHGIGRATAERFASEGAGVAVADLDRRAAEDVAASLPTIALGLEVDVASESEVTSMVDTVLRELGRIDVLHNNAGRLTRASVTELSVAEWDREFAVNVRSIFLTCRAVIPAMLEQGGGAIVNTASVSALVGESRIPAYSASKAAVLNLTRQLAADYSRSGVRVNCVCPGWIPTGFNDPLIGGMSDDELQAALDATVPLGRQGTVEEVAAAVAFLASDDASYIVGQALVVDGGLTACA